MTAEVATLLDEAQARRLTQRIGLLLDAASGALDKLAESIREARDGRADLALGYSSWAEYASAEFAPHTAGLTASIRRELVATLSIEVDGSPALSTRQIAPAVGVSQKTADRDVRLVSHVDSPAPYAPFDADAAMAKAIADATTPPFDPTTGEVLDEPAATIATTEGVVIAEQRHVVLGLDGKTYTRPETSAPRTSPRRPLVDAARDAGQELRKAIERLERIAADDRFARNKDEVAAHLRHHLAHAIEVCQDLNDQINR